jgi:polysaccharide biosynthesis/export protein
MMHHRLARMAMRRGVAPLFLFACCLAAGCQSNIYKASRLPPELAAPPWESSRAVDLSQLARPRVSNEQVFVGDTLEVAISTGLERQVPNRWLLRVADDGSVMVPLVGPVRVDGMVLPHAEMAIRDVSIARGIYVQPQVSVRLVDRRSVRVSVVGEVENPGDYELPLAQADLLAAISMAGGLKSETAGELIEITHPPTPHQVQQASYAGDSRQPSGNRTVRVNLHEVSAGRGGDFHLENGSVVMVAKQPPRTFSVIGLVRRPGQYEGLNDQDIRLLDALAIAGGRNLELADKVRIFRTVDGSDQPVVIQASVRDAKGGGPANIRLAPGDVVSVEETPLTFTLETIRSVLGFGITAPLPGI